MQVISKARNSEGDQAQSKTSEHTLVDAELGAMRVSCDIHQQIAEQSSTNGGRWSKARAETQVPTHTMHPSALRRCAGYCRAHIHARKQVRQRRMILPERHHAAQQVGAARERLSVTVAPPITIWLRAWRHIAHRRKRFSAVNRFLRASSKKVSVWIRLRSSQLPAGGRFISRTPGSGVTLNHDRNLGSDGGA